MTERRQRDWLVHVDRYEITGLDIAFEVVKSTKAEPNTCSLRIWNLAPAQRAALEALSLRPKQSGLQTGQIRTEIEVGHKSASRFLVFRGDLRTCFSATEGPDIITTIEGEDAGRGWLLGEVSQTFPAGTPYVSAVRACVRAMGLGEGNLPSAVALLPTVFAAGKSLDGPASHALTRLLASAGLRWSAQNGVLQVQRAGVPLATRAVLLSPGTGLVGSPARDATGLVYARALLIPELAPGGRVVFDAARVKGLYTVAKIRYVGDTAGNDWYADLACKEVVA